MQLIFSRAWLYQSLAIAFIIDCRIGWLVGSPLKNEFKL